MITLTKAQVFKYKSIEDSTPVNFAGGATVLVGKNESGKTAFLEALHKALPLGDAKFDPVYDFPRKDYVRYAPKHESKSYETVVELTFSIAKELTSKINEEVFNGVQVLAPGHIFTRSTHYGNASTISLGLDSARAFEAVKKPIEGLEHANEILAEVKSLDDLVAKIEAMDLTEDSRLTLFAKEWRARVKGSLDNWDMVGWHVWNSYLVPSLPKFLYFGDYNLLEGKINIETIKHRKANRQQLTAADETALGLFDLGGISLEELTSEEGYENSKAKLEAIGLTITEAVFNFWKQNRDLSVEFDIKTDTRDVPPFNNGKNLYIRVKNLRHGVTVPFDQRSKGFIWFFSFMTWFSSVEKRARTDKDLILLLDEPGLNLHALAQADFLSYIESLSASHQILYTTHSPFMVDGDRLENVRVVEDRPKEGTKVTENLEGSADDSLFPLQAALGYSIAQNLFVAKRNVLIEGASDLIILQHMSSLIEESGKGGLISDAVLVPVGGLDKLVTFISLLGANKLKIAVLHDRASSPHQKLEDLVRQKLIEKKKIFDYSMFRTPENQETDIEDLFPAPLYIDAFNDTYANQMNGKRISVEALGRHPRIIERINQWLSSEGIVLLKEGGFNHYRVAQTLLPKVTSKTLSADIFSSFESLFFRLNTVLA